LQRKEWSHRAGTTGQSTSVIGMGSLRWHPR
jgi:hypothetical protein